MLGAGTANIASAEAATSSENTSDADRTTLDFNAYQAGGVKAQLQPQRHDELPENVQENPIKILADMGLAITADESLAPIVPGNIAVATDLPTQAGGEDPTPPPLAEAAPTPDLYIGTYINTATNVNIRSTTTTGPTSTILEQLLQNTPIDVIAEIPGLDGNIWYEVSLDDDLIGYISSTTGGTFSRTQPGETGTPPPSEIESEPTENPLTITQNYLSTPEAIRNDPTWTYNPHLDTFERTIITPEGVESRESFYIGMGVTPEQGTVRESVRLQGENWVIIINVSTAPGFYRNLRLSDTLRSNPELLQVLTDAFNANCEALSDGRVQTLVVNITSEDYSNVQWVNEIPSTVSVSPDVLHFFALGYEELVSEGTYRVTASLSRSEPNDANLIAAITMALVRIQRGLRPGTAVADAVQEAFQDARNIVAELIVAELGLQSIEDVTVAHREANNLIFAK